MDLSPDQKVVYDGMLRWIGRPTQTLSVGGYAGTGKTTLLAKFIADHVGKRRMVCGAYTGKAANVLSQKLSKIVGNAIEVTTIHRLIYNPYENEDGDIRFKRRMSMFGAGSPGSKPYDVIILDEASMVSDRMLNDILEYRIPVLAIGDHGQLPPVGDSGSLMVNPNLRLEKIHRQAESSPIIQVAHAVREHGRFPWPLPSGVSHMTEMPFRSALASHVTTSTPEQLYDSAVLCYTNRARCTFNKMIRAHRWGAEAAEAGPRIGDVVICLRNDHTTGIFNGMRGVIEAHKPKKGHFDWMKIRFPDDNKVFTGDVLRAQFGRERTFSNVDDLKKVKGLDLDKVSSINDMPCSFFDYGYAMTVHKSQGSQFHTVFLVLEFKPSDEQEPGLWRRWAYTGVTRTVENLTLVERR